MYTHSLCQIWLILFPAKDLFFLTGQAAKILDKSKGFYVILQLSSKYILSFVTMIGGNVKKNISGVSIFQLSACYCPLLLGIAREAINNIWFKKNKMRF